MKTLQQHNYIKHTGELTYELHNKHKYLNKLKK